MCYAPSRHLKQLVRWRKLSLLYSLLQWLITWGLPITKSPWGPNCNNNKEFINAVGISIAKGCAYPIETQLLLCSGAAKWKIPPAIVIVPTTHRRDLMLIWIIRKDLWKSARKQAEQKTAKFKNGLSSAIVNKCMGLHRQRPNSTSYLLHMTFQSKVKIDILKLSAGLSHELQLLPWNKCLKGQFA